MPTSKFDQAMTLLGLNHEDRGLHLISVTMEAGRVTGNFAKTQSVTEINQSVAPTGPGVLIIPEHLALMALPDGPGDITIPGVGRLRIPAGATIQFVPEEATAETP
ncbi:hypothetical protein [Nocardia fluminea]|uniref:hypothetical protein n=1 Tax=Nocardia fluminea TaxID=134984 RepID=UPI00365B5546